MRQRQRTWLVGINIAIGLVIGLSCGSTWLLLIADHLGLTSKVSILQWLDSWSQPMVLIAIVVYLGGSATYAWVRKRNASSR